MAILTAELKLYHSHGGSNANIALDIDGDISSAELTDNTLNNLFPDVSGDQSAAGLISYRKCFFKNTNATLSGTATKLWILSQTTASGDAITIGKDPAGLNAAGADIANELAVPAGVSFVTAVDKANGLDLGTVTAGGRWAIWVKRTVDAGAGAADADSYQLKAECDTTA